MKILFFSFPGFADCGLPMIKALQDKGVDITYIIEVTPTCLNCNLFSIKQQLPIDDLIPAQKYPELEVYSNYCNLDKVLILNRTTKSASGFTGFIMALKLIKYIKKEKFDLIHTDYQPYMWLTMLYAFKKRLVFTVHDPFPHYGEGTRIKTFFRKMAFKYCSNFVLLNKNQGEAFQSFYKIKSDRVYYNKLGIYECMNINSSDTLKKRPENRILFFGRISPYKGIEYLCEAMEFIIQDIPNAKLVIAGGGKYYFDKSKYEQMPYIEFRNKFISMEELSDLLKECNVAVCPYTEATQSGVIMSAFAFLKPVVATRVGGLGEMIRDGETGFLVEAKNPHSLAEAIIKILKNVQIQQNMAVKIEEDYYNGEFSWKAIASQYINIYNNIINKFQ